VAEDRGGIGESVAGQLHPVAGVAREPDDHALLRQGGLRRHLTSLKGRVLRVPTVRLPVHMASDDWAESDHVRPSTLRPSHASMSVMQVSVDRDEAPAADADYEALFRRSGPVLWRARSWP